MDEPQSTVDKVKDAISDTAGKVQDKVEQMGRAIQDKNAPYLIFVGLLLGAVHSCSAVRWHSRALRRLGYFPVQNEIVFVGCGGNCAAKARTE